MERLVTPQDSTTRVAVFLSGSGTTGVKLLEDERRLLRLGEKPYSVTVLFTDNERDDNNAERIAADFDLPLIRHNLSDFLRRSGIDPKDRPERFKAYPYYFREVSELLDHFKVDMLALAGFEVIVTDPLLTKFKNAIINHHPADLTIRKPDGSPKYVGANVVPDEILAGEKRIHATTHLVTADVDGGNPLFISDSVEVRLPEGVSLEQLRDPQNMALLRQIAKSNQDRLKEAGDWIIFPLTVKHIAQGRFTIDQNDVVYFDGIPIPLGVRLEDNPLKQQILGV